MKLKFEEDHGVTIFEDPDIEIKMEGLSIASLEPKTISVDIFLSVEGLKGGASHYVRLENVAVNNFNGEEDGTLELRVMEHLKQFEV